MLKLFNMICLGLFLKLKTDTKAMINENKVIAAMMYLLPKSSTSKPVKCSAAAQSAAIKTKTVCIRCSIFSNWFAKIAQILHNSKNSVDLHYKHTVII